MAEMFAGSGSIQVCLFMFSSNPAEASDKIRGCNKSDLTISFTGSSDLLDSLRWAGNRVFQAVVLVNGLPEFSIRVVLLQRVGAFGLEVLKYS